MVLAYHSIFCTYGFWLPNDPRGSWSDFVGAWELFRFGLATKTNTRRSVAGKGHDQAFRRAAKASLKRAPIQLSGPRARDAARGMSEYLQEAGVAVWAFSILPSHVHLVTASHRLRIESIINQIKGRATRYMQIERPWARKSWNVFLNSPTDIERAIRYVENNPVKERLPRQRWHFIKPFSAKQFSRDPQGSAFGVA
jgi:REP element-mobilizing transposase RayT